MFKSIKTTPSPNGRHRPTFIGVVYYTKNPPSARFPIACFAVHAEILIRLGWAEYNEDGSLNPLSGEYPYWRVLFDSETETLRLENSKGWSGAYRARVSGRLFRQIEVEMKPPVSFPLSQDDVEIAEFAIKDGGIEFRLPQFLREVKQ